MSVVYTVVRRLPAFASRFVSSVLLAFAVLFCAPAGAQVAYNGTQTTIISGITSGGQYGYGLAVDLSGNVFVSGMGQPNSYVLEYSKSTGYQYNGVYLTSDFDGPTYGSSAYSIAFDNRGLLYVPAASLQYVAVWQPGDPILGATAYGTYPNGVGYGLDGNMYVADTVGDEIYEISLTGGNSGGIIQPPCYPSSVTADSAGNVYVPCGSQVLKYSNLGGGNYSGSVVTNNLSNAGYAQGGIAVDRNGIVYVCDSHNNRVLREVPRPGGGYSESPLPWSYNDPSGVALDDQGNLYVSDTLNGKVDEISFPTAQFGGQALGTTSAPQTFSFTIGSGTNIGKIVSLTGGQPAKDFPFTTTCALGVYASTTTCSLTVSFSPAAVGTRNGAIVFYDQNGNILYMHAASGIGQAPQLVFNAPYVPTGLTQPAYTSSAGMALDDAGNLFVANQTVDINNYPLYAGSILEYPSTNTTGGAYGAPFSVTGPSTPISSALYNPFALTVQPNGDLIVFCDNPNQNTSHAYIVYDVPKTQTGYGAPFQIASGNSQAVASAVTDSQANVYYLAYDRNYNATIYKIAFEGYTYLPPTAVVPATIVASGFTSLGGLTIDTSGNLYVAAFPGGNLNSTGSILEFTASPGYKASTTVATGLISPQFLAMEPNGSLIVGNQTQDEGPNGNIQVLPATPSGFGAPVTVVSGLDLPNGLAVDRFGNLFITTGYSTGTGPDVLATTVYRRTQSPLSFPSTPKGSESGPQVATIQNLGNQPLNFSALGFAPDFPESSSDTTDCSTTTPMAPGGLCTLTIDFSPNAAIPAGKTSVAMSETATVTTNSLNATNAVASVALSGVETLPLATLTLTPSSSSTVYGVPLTLTATVAGNSAGSDALPTGSVKFYSGSSLLGTATLSASASVTGSASLTTAKLAAGPDSLTFVYSGNANYTSGTSAAVPVTIAQATPSVALAITPAAISPTKQATLKATVSSGISGVTPTGTVAFTYYGASAPSGAVLNTATLNSAGTASITQLLPPGQGAITATYSGNSNLTAATSGYVGVDVVALPTTVNVTSSARQIAVGTAVTLKASLSGLTKGYVPTGGFTFFANSVEIGSAVVSSSGSGSFATSNLPVGTNSITVSYSGDSNYASESSSPIAVTAIPDTPKFTLGSLPSAPVFDQNIALTAAIATTDGTTAATGSITFILDNKTVGSGTLVAGSANVKVGTLSIGTHHFQAIYNGDSNYAPGTSAVTTLTVAKAIPVVSLTSTGTKAGATATLYANVLGPSSSPQPTGTVTFYAGSTSLGTVGLGNGKAILTATLPSGSYNLTATYNGDANYASATSPPLGVE